MPGDLNPYKDRIKEVASEATDFELGYKFNEMFHLIKYYFYGDSLETEVFSNDFDILDELSDLFKHNTPSTRRTWFRAWIVLYIVLQQNGDMKLFFKLYQERYMMLDLINSYHLYFVYDKVKSLRDKPGDLLNNVLFF